MNFDERRILTDKLKNNAYYILIALVSLVSVVFLPMLTSNVNTQFQIPETFAGICVWVMSKLCVALINILIFYSFTKQAIVNIKDNEDFKKANEKLHKIKCKDGYKAISPEKFVRKQWLSKGTTILISSLLSTFVITEAILSFSLVQFLAYLFTVFTGVVFGYITMRGNEEYWVIEFPMYVADLEREYLEASNVAQNVPIFDVSSEPNKNIMGNDKTSNVAQNVPIFDVSLEPNKNIMGNDKTSNFESLEVKYNDKNRQ